MTKNLLNYRNICR